MKALLLKDFYVLWKQMKAFLVLILLFLRSSRQLQRHLCRNLRSHAPLLLRGL